MHAPILLLPFFLGFHHGVNAGSILVFVMPQSPSHRRGMYPIANALGDRGHNVTVFSDMFSDDGLRSEHPNVSDRFAFIKSDDADVNDMWLHQNSSLFMQIQWEIHSNHPLIWHAYWSMGIDICNLTIHQKREEIFRLISQKWDLIIIDSILATCGMVLTKWINAPYIIFNPTCASAFQASHRSVPHPPSTLPAFASMLNYDNKEFIHRMHSALSYGVEYALPFLWNTRLDNVVKEKYDKETIAYFTWFYGNPELEFTDVPMALDHVRPLLPDVRILGGHCKTVTPLDHSEWSPFLDDPTSKGTILMSFGHRINWKHAPDHIIHLVFDALNLFDDYRIAFQYDGPARAWRKHVKTSSWLPVIEILNHGKTKIHVTHGGVKTIKESMCAGIPLVILPLFAEQMLNAESIRRIGIGDYLDKRKLTTEKVADTLREVLRNKAYAHRMKKMKSFMMDQIQPPLDTAVFWAEQIVRKKKLPDAFFKHKGRHLGWIEYFNIDVMLLITVFLFFKSQLC